MSVDPAELSPVFSSLLDDSFWDKIDSFDDKSIRPFLPYLISSVFQETSSDGVTQSLLARLSSFPEGNRLIQLTRIDFSSLESELTSCVKYEDYGSFTMAPDVTKIKILCRFIIDESKDDANASPFLTNDVFEDASLMLSIAYIHMPSMFSIEKLTLRLLSHPIGPQLLISLIANAPELLKPVLSILLALQISDECSRGRQKANVLNLLFYLCPSICWSSIHEMSTSRRDCLLAVRLACAHLSSNDVISLLRPFLLDRSSQLSSTIGRSAATLKAVHDRLVGIMKNALEKKSTDPLTGVLQCAVSLQMNFARKFVQEHLSIISAFICRREVVDDCHLVVALASLVSIQVFTNPPHQDGMPRAVDGRISDWLAWLKEISSVEAGSPVLSNTLTYLCVCLSASRLDHLNKMLAGILKCNVTINHSHFTALKTLFNSSCLAGADLASRCASLPITPGLCISSGPRLPIHSVSELMLSGSFVRYHVDISSWLESQLLSSRLPLHPLLPELIERFAVDAARQHVEGLNTQFVETVFSGDFLSESLLTARCLALLFLLSYRAQLDQMGTKAKGKHPSSTYSRIPIRYLLSVVERRKNDFRSARGSLIRLTTDLFPYMLPTIDSIELAGSQQKGIPMRETVDELLSSISPDHIPAAVLRIAVAPLSDQVRLLPVVVSSFLPSISASRPMIHDVISIWKRLENVVPRMLYESSSLSWCDFAHDVSDFYESPALLFRCNRSIFSSPAHFRCFVRLLSFFVSASRNQLMRSVHAANCATPQGDAERTDREQLSVALDHTQASLIVQLLVEVGDGTRMGDAPSDCGLARDRASIRSIACEYIHQLFIQDKSILKLVLFQTLPLHMVPLLVEGIPSMFVAVDFIQEMLTLPNLNRRIFAISLMVHIAHKYRIASSCVATELILDVLHTLLRYTETAVNMQLFVHVVPVLAKVSTVFPNLAPDVSQLLLRVSTLAKARMALQPMSIMTSECLEKKLLNLIHDSLISNCY